MKKSQNYLLYLSGLISENDMYKILEEEREIQTYAAWKVAAKKAGAVRFNGDKDIDEALDANGKSVGDWDGAVGRIY